MVVVAVAVVALAVVVLLAVGVVVVTVAEVVLVAAVGAVFLMLLVPLVALRLVPSGSFRAPVVRDCWENLVQHQVLNSLRRNLRHLVLQNLWRRFLFHQDLTPGLRFVPHQKHPQNQNPNFQQAFLVEAVPVAVVVIVVVVAIVVGVEALVFAAVVVVVTIVAVAAVAAVAAGSEIVLVESDLV